MKSVDEIIDYSKINELRNLDLINNGSFLNEIIDLYISQLNNLKKDIQCSFYKNEFSITSKAAHNLKGASLNLGAIALADISKKIENQINENYNEKIEELIAQLEPVSKITTEILEEIKKNG